LELYKYLDSSESFMQTHLEVTPKPHTYYSEFKGNTQTTWCHGNGIMRKGSCAVTTNKILIFRRTFPFLIMIVAKLNI